MKSRKPEVKESAAFVQACMGGDLAGAKRLYTKERAVSADANGQQPIHWASFAGQLEVVKWLSSHGVPLDVKNKDGRQPLLFACAGGHLPLAKWLHSPPQGIALSVANNKGIQPLHYACLGGHQDLAVWLHSEGVALDVAVRDGQLPIHSACYGGHAELVKWLASEGVALDVATNVLEAAAKQHEGEKAFSCFGTRKKEAERSGGSWDLWSWIAPGFCAAPRKAVKQESSEA